MIGTFAAVAVARERHASLVVSGNSFVKVACIYHILLIHLLDFYVSLLSIWFSICDHALRECVLSHFSRVRPTQ